MSVLVAYTHKNGCCVGYDSAAVGDGIVIQSNTAKAVKHAGGGIVGAVGSWRIINMINQIKDAPITVDVLIALLKESKNEEDWSDSEVLFVSPGEPIVLFQTQGFSTVEIKSPFMAIGAGGPYAIGYLSFQPTFSVQAVKGAVTAAAKWSPYVSLPAKLINIEH